MPDQPMSELPTELKRVGKLARMPAKMISEMPLPTPFSVISSPSQIRNMVPAVMVIKAEMVGNHSSLPKPMPVMARAFSSNSS